MGFPNSAGDERHEGPNPDLLVIEQLRRAGADPSRPHETRHFLYVPGVKAARFVARALMQPNRRIEVDTSARKGYWLVAVIQSTPITPEAIAKLREEFETAAELYGGEYNCWQVAIADE
jgi:hypothetical protein